jgi:Ser/Thr protein kinase RdoA (MazF antagonist)
MLPTAGRSRWGLCEDGFVQLLRPGDETMRALVDAFGLDGTPRGLTPISRGGNGRVWRMDLGGPPRSYAVKELFAGGDERRIAATEEFRALAVAAGVRAPDPSRTAGGRYLADVDGVVVRISSWLEGREPQAGDPGVAEWLGRTLATLHTLGHPVSRADGVPGDPPIPSPATWLSLAEQGAAAGRPWAAPLSRAAPELALLGAKTRPVDPDRLVFSHHDVQPSNVLFDPETGEYALLDWDGAGPIDPGRELASRLYTWHVHDDHLDAGAARRTLRAYRAAGGVAVIGEPEAYGGLPDGLAYIANQARASLDRSLPVEMREHSTRETCLLLSDPPSGALFEQILELGRTLAGENQVRPAGPGS